MAPLLYSSIYYEEHRPQYIEHTVWPVILKYTPIKNISRILVKVTIYRNLYENTGHGVWYV